MKIACNGATGRVGRLLVEKHGVVPLFADITKPQDVAAELDAVKPEVVLHLAGLSNVDYCELRKNQDEVIRVNFTGAYNLFRLANERDIAVGYLSSEHVFTGKKTLWWGGGPYNEKYPLSKPPVNYYGTVRLATEIFRHSFNLLKVVRTSYLFDYNRLVNQLLPWDITHRFATFIDRSYMYLPHFVENLYQYASTFFAMPKVLHLAGAQTVSQYQLMSDFAFEFAPTVKVTKRRKPYKIDFDILDMAPRPFHAGLDVSLSARLGFRLYDYKDGFEQMRKDNE